MLWAFNNWQLHSFVFAIERCALILIHACIHTGVCRPPDDASKTVSYSQGNVFVGKNISYTCAKDYFTEMAVGAQLRSTGTMPCTEPAAGSPHSSYGLVKKAPCKRTCVMLVEYPIVYLLHIFSLRWMFQIPECTAHDVPGSAAGSSRNPGGI